MKRTGFWTYIMVSAAAHIAAGAFAAGFLGAGGYIGVNGPGKGPSHQVVELVSVEGYPGGPASASAPEPEETGKTGPERAERPRPEEKTVKATPVKEPAEHTPEVNESPEARAEKMVAEAQIEDTPAAEKPVVEEAAEEAEPSASPGRTEVAEAGDTEEGRALSDAPAPSSPYASTSSLVKKASYGRGGYSGGGMDSGGVGGTTPIMVEGLAKPAYPVLSRRRGEEGTVVVTATVSPGEDPSFEVTRSSGSPRLDRAALRAVGSARFTPAKRAGRPVPSTRSFAFVFRLDR